MLVLLSARPCQSLAASCAVCLSVNTQLQHSTTGEGKEASGLAAVSSNRVSCCSESATSG